MISKKIKKLLICLLLVSTATTTGFMTKTKTPHTVYHIYLKGKSLGIIKSKKELENYIDKRSNI